MTSRNLIFVGLCFLAGACSAPEGPPLTVSNVVVLEALPGTEMSVGYLTLENNSNQSIAIDRMTSPQFTRVEMHQTLIEDDVARMAPLTSLVIEPRSSVQFETGGKHLMMSGPQNQVQAGLPVTIEIHFDSNGLLIVATTVSTRNDYSDPSR